MNEHGNEAGSGNGAAEPAEGPSVHAIVLAGATRWGSSPFEKAAPKPTLPVALTPLVCHVLRWLRAGRVRQVTLCTNRASAKGVRRCVSGGAFDELEVDHIEDSTPRGPAGCARDAGSRSRADVFIVTEGGIIPMVDLAALVKRHARTGAAVTVVVKRHEGSRGGTRAGRLSPAGIYVFDRRVFGFIPEAGHQDLKEGLVNRLNEAGERILPYEDLVAPRVSCRKTFLAANAWLVGRMLAEESPPDGFRVHDESLVHLSARVDLGARLVGPVLVGPSARVHETAVLVGPAVLGEGSTVEGGALFTRSVLFPRATVGAGAVVDRSIVAEDGAVAREAQVDGVVVLPHASWALAAGPFS